MKVNAGTIARTAVLAVSLLNVLLNAFGKNPLPFSDDEVYTTVSTVVARGGFPGRMVEEQQLYKSCFESR